MIPRRVLQGVACGEHGREADVRRIIPRMGIARSDATFRRMLVQTHPVGHCSQSKLYRGKVTRSWRCRSPRRTIPSTPVAEWTLCSVGDEFVLCQGESGSGASLGACDGSGTLSRVRPVVRLMSDRESVSGVSTPHLGFDAGRAPLNRTARVQRRCVYMIRKTFVLLKEWTKIRVSCRR